MSAVPAIMTPADYLAFERAAETKHEFIDGRVYAMAGASRWHGIITMNIGANLHAALRNSDCSTVSSDMRVRVPSRESYVYPDVVVFCGEGEWLDDTFDTLQNPIVVFEILSPSTERHDRVRKFAQYRESASLDAFILVSQDRVLVEVYERAEGEQWLYTALTRRENELHLRALDVSVPLSEIYFRVELDEEGP